MTSAPPPPSIVSAPDPVVIVLADDDPVTVSAVENMLALTFSKFATATASPVVWSAPAATPRLIAVVLPVAENVSVSVPPPPSIEVSVPR